ncbi:MAG: hypothetical protein ACOX4L_00265 [Bacillota bacterium]
MNIDTPSTATSATKQPTSIDIPRFYAVAVPKSSATSTATTATKKTAIRKEERRRRKDGS